jgi:hypothetical protein
MRRQSLAAALVATAMLATATGCGSKSNNASPTATLQTSVGPSPSATSSPGGGPTPKPSPPAGQTWPTPEDCVAYNPGGLTKHYEAGIWAILDGTRTVARAPGGPAENVGDQALALAKRYRKHCFLGRANTRTEKYSYIFDYWLDPSGSTPPIPDENCSGYDKNNLTVEDMGGGNGWRVKDHDHVLHLFDNGTDARNGKLVIGKYSQICFIGGDVSSEHGQELLSYFHN